MGDARMVITSRDKKKNLTQLLKTCNWLHETETKTEQDEDNVNKRTRIHFLV